MPAKGTWIEQINKRTRNGKKRVDSADSSHFAVDYTIGSLHYKDNPDDPVEQWKEIDNIFEPALTPWDWQMLKAGYHIRVKEDFTAGQIIEFQKGSESVQFQPMALEWTNDLDQIQQISMPQNVTPIITNPEVDLLPAVGMPSHQGTIRWNDAYGDELDFSWRCTSTRLIKILEVENLNKLPVPEQFILDGGNPVLRLNLIFDPSDVDIIVDGELWDKQAKKQTFNRIGFWKDGEELWGFLPLKYWGSYSGNDPDLMEANAGRSVATLERRGNKLYISIRVPYEWLQGAVYPVYIDTDIDPQPAVIGASADDRNDRDNGERYPVDGDTIYVHQYTEGDEYRRHGGLRFTGIGIAKGSDIDVAHLTLWVDGSNGNQDAAMDIYCEDQESPPNFADSSALVQDRVRTGNSAEWVEENVVCEFPICDFPWWTDTPSLVSPVQEISTDYGVGTIVFLLIAKIGASKFLTLHTYDYDDHSHAPQLHIEYTAAAPTAAPWNIASRVAMMGA